MANPTPYDPDYSFSGYQSVNPTRPLPAPRLDVELANISLSIGETQGALADVRRSDGALRNGIVTYDSLGADVARGIPEIPIWLTGTNYALKDRVFINNTVYECVIAHLSTVFATDLAAGRWAFAATTQAGVATAQAAAAAASAVSASNSAAAAAASAASYGTEAVTTGTDLNTVVTLRRIVVTAPTNPPVVGAGLRWLVETYADPTDADGVVQRATLLDGGPTQEWGRSRSLAGAWGVWTLIGPFTPEAKFPSWRSSNGQFGTNYATFRAARDNLAAAESALPKASGGKTVGPSVGGTAGNLFSAVVRMADSGRYFGVPHTAAAAFIYNERTGVVTTVPFSPTGSASYNGGALLPSGRVAMIPDSRTTLLAYNPSTETFDILQSGLPGSNAYNGGTIGWDTVNQRGVLVLTPHNAAAAGFYDEATSTFTNSANTSAGSIKYVGGIALPDGKVLHVPHSANCVAISDPTTKTTLFKSNTSFPASESFCNGALVNDTMCIFFPHKHTHCVLYDFVNDTWANIGAQINFLTAPNNSAFNGGVRLLDGRFLVTPYRDANARIIEITNASISAPAATVTVPPGSYGNINAGACKNGVVMENGDVIFAPFNFDTILFAATGHGTAVSPELLTGPHLNRG